MKLSVATALLASCCAVSAFQQPAASARKITSLNTIALNPFGNNKVQTPPPEEPKKKNDSFDMNGIALSVSEKEERHCEVVRMEDPWIFALGCNSETVRRRPTSLCSLNTHCF